MQTYLSVRPIWNMSRKPYLQCFTRWRIFSGSRVIAEKSPSKTINRLLRSLKGKRLSYEHWTNVFVFSTLCLFAREIWQLWSDWYGTNSKEKTSHRKAALLTTLVGLIFSRNKLCSNYSISQGIGGFISFQTMKIVSMFAICQLVACLRTKFGNVEAVDRLQIRKKNCLAKRQLHWEHWQVRILKETKNAVNTA